MIVVDAANVVGARADGWWRDRAGAARRLLAELAAAALSEDVVVVLEGAARAALDGTEYTGVRVVAAPGTGDDTVVEVAAAAGTDVTVVTADRELRRRVEAVGARTVGPRTLLDRLG
ncbi:hypothetical protein [Nocardia sp. NPDC057353]|uniref:hypothetical protein n=1 Tax=Nocardia sp. NPDC057353 TaxID=3346104 RepID=UPI0036262180